MADLWCITFEITDEKSKKAHVQVCVDGALAWATVAAFVQDAAELLNDVVGGLVSGANVSRAVTLTGMTGPSSGADREEGGLIVFQSAGGTTRQRIPTMVETFITSGTNLINTSSGAIQTWLQMMVAGITSNSVLVEPVDSRGDDITNILSAKEDFRRY